ncbi:dihydrofolate reductase [Clostridium sp. DJ247]|uniref:dihydrofolate reductase n=1 Tax=Clostridium sp. DJ247 TaxID=2726188 RepID=UPI001624447F|nr:dihydrofolate reductase [Clostridium sp. DJ247]MBC2579267.1 dihydrofolate reductase [Clostridium sp. DJ247]MBC2579282.1 dihydrofolate reductase [Clostridium sp. DJ247]
MINLIAAVAKNNGIGNNNSLLCHIKQDLQYFKRVTKEHTVVMGYNTYESLPIKPLPDRTNVVVTTKNIEIDGVTVVHSIDEVMSLEGEVFICGGASIYEQMLPYADKLYITHIFQEFDSDTFFPDIDENVWELEKATFTKENITHKYPHIFAIYKKSSR